MNATLLSEHLSRKGSAHLRLRVWAADIRDGKSPAPSAAVGWASALANVLKTIEALKSTGYLCCSEGTLRDLEANKDSLLAKLAQFGMGPPVD